LRNNDLAPKVKNLGEKSEEKLCSQVKNK
jgi:hypothetical protein